MADKNRNGVDDALEKYRRTTYGAGVPGNSNAVHPWEQQAVVNNKARDRRRGTPVVDNQSGPLGAPDPGISLNAPGPDWWNYQNTANGVRKVGNLKPGGRGLETEHEKSLADYMALAAQLMGEYSASQQSSGGSSGPSLVNYDPQRQTLRSNASENDARLEAMYRQLRGSIEADAPKIQGAYQGAMDSTAQATQTAQQQIQGATDAANARNNEVLSNLGIQEAQRNQIQEGRDLNTQTAHQIADSATIGQASQSRLAQNQQTALDYNRGVGQAAGLEGNLQRAVNQQKLSQLLAQIDMQEQSQNASARNAYSSSQSASGPSFADIMDTAQQLLGFDQYNQKRDDNLQIQAQKSAAHAYTPAAFQSWLAQQGVDLPTDPLDRARAISYYQKVFTG